MATHLEETDNGTWVLLVATDKSRFSVRARHFVLAAGAIETARLLLNSRRPNGRALGNANDLVGRFFMEHPHFPSGVLTPSDPRVLSAEGAHAIHIFGGELVQRTYGLPSCAEEREGLPRATYILQPVPDSAQLARLGFGDGAKGAIRQASALRRRAPNRYAPKGVATLIAGSPYLLGDSVGRGLEAVGKRFRWRRYLQPRHFKLYAMAEQIPNPDSRVALIDELDRFGVPLATLNWQLTPEDLRGYRRTQALLGRAFAGAGVGRTRSFVERTSELPGLIGGAHHMGTTRMSHNPRSGVVDPDGRLHESPNVWVTGSAVFPTVGYANPSLTVVALALRLAEQLRASLT